MHERFNQNMQPSLKFDCDFVSMKHRKMRKFVYLKKLQTLNRLNGTENELLGAFKWEDLFG